MLASAVALLLVPADVSAGAWTLPQGRVWAKIAFLQQQTDEWYLASPEFIGQLFSAGTRRPYRFNGEYDSKAVFIEAWYGVTDRLDIGVQLPYFDQVFDDDTRLVPPSEKGFSDLRLGAKLQALQRPLVVTLKGVVKLPTGDFQNEDGLIPVGEGQWDFDFVLQLGRSLWPLPLYGNVDIGYRVRLENKEIVRDPGDEWLINAEVGYNITRKLLLAAKVEMLRGKAGTDFGFKNRSQIKRITYLSPTIMFNITGDTTVELSYRKTLNGRNFPAGHQLAIGVSQGFDLGSPWGR